MAQAAAVTQLPLQSPANNTFLFREGNELIKQNKGDVGMLLYLPFNLQRMLAIEQQTVLVTDKHTGLSVKSAEISEGQGSGNLPAKALT